MKSRKLMFLLGLILLSGVMYAQQFTLSGSVTNSVTGEPLPFSNIVYGEGKGTVADGNGNFVLNLPKGNYTIIVSYVGAEKVVKEVLLDKNIQLNFNLKSIVLQEFEVVADFAKMRETPVAFSTIPVTRIQEELASQDIPMILNKTPGVYATQQGGGDGDARINIRGFNQRNIAVMIDGIPVNDMENGWVYWSNWFGLDMATRSIQVQRGLGASKLAIPSVGGTMNILTTGIESRRALSVKQEVGSDQFMRSSVVYNSGKMKNGWGITLAGSYKQGNGEVDMTWTKGYFYFFRVDKKLGKHLLSITGMGAPQSHGQRAYTMALSRLDTAWAHKLGIDSTQYSPGPVNLGYNHNPHWGWLCRDSASATGAYEKINEKLNYYHKPQFSIRDFWTISSKMSVSNIIYLSLGDGGGTGLTATPPPILTGPQAGLVDFQQVYDNNIDQNGTSTAGKGIIMRSAVNNHLWAGLLSTADCRINDQLKISGGIDARYYLGQHYQQVYDLLGADYWIDEVKTSELRDKTDPSNKRYLNDIVGYHNDGIVQWGGLFGQAEYKLKKWNFFFNASGSETGYQRKDYFLKKDLVIGDTIIEQAVGYIRKFNLGQGGFISIPDTFLYQEQKYTINSPEARTATTPYKWIAGYTMKAGANFNLSKTSNIFANLGYLNKAPRFNNVYDKYNHLYQLIENEIVKAGEVGYNFYNSRFTLNLNAYYTVWNNKPADYAPTVVIDDITYNVNINGVDALHKGVEMELGVNLMPGLISETVLSLGDWRWTSADSARVVDQNTGDVIKTVLFDAKGLYVGDAAQQQFRQSFRYEWRKTLYLSGGITWFGKHYSNFDPLNYDPVSNKWAFDQEGNPKQSWRVPNYFLVDVNAGYSFRYYNLRGDLRFSILNLTNEKYISDASNNDGYTGQTFNSFDAKSAAVFLGSGRKYNLSLRLSI
jgi:iron complex outermembrane recepter protein